MVGVWKLETAYLNRRVESAYGSSSRLGLGRSDGRLGVKDLPVQVTQLDVVVVDDSHVSDSGGG